MADEAHFARQSDYDDAFRLFGEGLNAEQVEAKLVENGLSPADAQNVVQEILIRSLYAEAVESLQGGMLPQQVEKQLREERGLSAETAKTIVDNAKSMRPEDLGFQGPAEASEGPGNPALMIIGGIIFVVGVILFIGNISGAFPTFPCAGWLTIVIGGAIWGAGKKH